MFLHRVIRFWEKLCDKVKGRFSKQLMPLIVFPKDVNGKVLALGPNRLPASLRRGLFTPGKPFLGKFGR